jgi:hypothetical protein
MSRDYRLVSRDGVASAAELQREQDAMIRRHREHGAPETTVDALMFSLRSRGLAALDEPDTGRRLSELSRSQVAQVVVRLNRLRAKYPNINDKLIGKIGEVYEAN